MALYTYDDFQKALQASGLANNMSASDIKLAQQNPDAGMSILGYKQDWAGATTDEAKLLANQSANDTRTTYGNYSGGADGSKYNLGTNGDSGDATPSYISPYQGNIDSTMASLLGYGDFSYNKETDPNWAPTKQSYMTQSDRATQNALGSAAANTGGLASSAAVTAATQAGDYYLGQLNDAELALYKQAYAEYSDGYSRLSNNMATLLSADNANYSKYADAQNLSYTKDQASITNALNEWTAAGYASPSVAATLGVKEGTPTSDQSYKTATLANAAKKTTKTGTGTGIGTEATPDANGTVTFSDGKTAIMTPAEYKSVQALKSGTYTADDFNAIVANGVYTAAEMEAQGFNKDGATAAAGTLSDAAKNAKQEALKRVELHGATDEDISDFLGDLVDVYHTISKAEAHQILKELGYE